MAEFEDFVQTELPLRPVVTLDEDEETLLVRRGPPKNYVAVPLQEGQVVGKEGGVIKGVDNNGSGGGGDKNYVHVQAMASAVWQVPHNLGKMVSITVVDTGGTTVEGDMTHDDLNNITIIFSAPFTGQVFCN
ncbi:MAG: hypothetical protein DRQ39_08490 [Gammaproteobacteria bacterium]|nr:MAG: hypothetical protein DRQ39_08490 [Gammaproteobacteria bacterium]